MGIDSSGVTPSLFTICRVRADRTSPVQDIVESHSVIVDNAAANWRQLFTTCSREHGSVTIHARGEQVATNTIRDLLDRADERRRARVPSPRGRYQPIPDGSIFSSSYEHSNRTRTLRTSALSSQRNWPTHFRGCSSHDFWTPADLCGSSLLGSQTLSSSTTAPAASQAFCQTCHIGQSA